MLDLVTALRLESAFAGALEGSRETVFRYLTEQWEEWEKAPARQYLRPSDSKAWICVVTLKGAARQAEEDGCLMEVAFWTDLHYETPLGAILEALVGRVDWSRARNYSY